MHVVHPNCAPCCRGWASGRLWYNACVQKRRPYQNGRLREDEVMGMSNIQRTTSQITLQDRWDHLLARCGVNRSGHRVEPGLYALRRIDPPPAAAGDR